MSRWKYGVLLSGGAIALLAALTLSGPQADQSQGQGYAPVKVINGAAEPVPIQGTTSISGTPSMTIANTPLPVNVTNASLQTVALGTTQVAGSVQAQQSGSWGVSVAGTVQAEQSGSWNVSVSGTPDVNIVNSPTVTVGNGESNPVFVRDVGATAVGLPATGRTLGGPAAFSASASTTLHEIYTSWTPMKLCLTADNFGAGGVQFFFVVGSVSRAFYVSAGSAKTGCSDSVDAIRLQCASGCDFDWRIDAP